MKNKWKYIGLLLGLVALAAGLAIIYHWRPLAVELARPEQNVPVQAFGLGTVEARTVSKVGFKIIGSLADLSVDHGDTVRKGDVLARLVNEEQDRRLAKSQANLERIRASLQVAKANMDKSRTSFRLREQANQRRQKLMKVGVLAGESAEESRASLDISAAEVSLAISEAAAAQAAVKDGEAQLELDKILLGQHVLLAPYDAVVMTRHKELGSIVGIGEPVFTLVDPATVWIKAYIDEARAGHLRVGQPADIKLRSLPDRTLSGRVVRIDMESDRATEERIIYVAPEKGLENFHLGEQAEVVVTMSTLEHARLVPQAAVEQFTGRNGFVWTVENGSLNRRAVSFGWSTLDGRLEITKGLPEGAQVLAKLPPGLRVGRTVKVQEGI